MRDEDKPFIAYRQGKWNLKIVPRSAAGWRAFGVWLALLMLLTVGFTALVASDPDNSVFAIWLTVGFLIVVGLWIWAMIRWMLARSEIIDLDELLAAKRRRDRQRGKRR